MNDSHPHFKNVQRGGKPDNFFWRTRVTADQVAMKSTTWSRLLSSQILEQEAMYCEFHEETSKEKVKRIITSFSYSAIVQLRFLSLPCAPAVWTSRFLTWASSCASGRSNSQIKPERCWKVRRCRNSCARGSESKGRADAVALWKQMRRGSLYCTVGAWSCSLLRVPADLCVLSCENISQSGSLSKPGLHIYCRAIYFQTELSDIHCQVHTRQYGSPYASPSSSRPHSTKLIRSQTGMWWYKFITGSFAVIFAMNSGCGGFSLPNPFSLFFSADPFILAADRKWNVSSLVPVQAIKSKQSGTSRSQLTKQTL